MMKNLSVLLLLLALFPVSYWEQEKIIEKKKILESPDTIDLSKSWHFSPDEKDIGMSEKWYALNYDDSQWDILDAGKQWEVQGYPDLDSLAWYRKVISIPADWQGKEVWLKFSGVNDNNVLIFNILFLLFFNPISSPFCINTLNYPYYYQKTNK